MQLSCPFYDPLAATSSPPGQVERDVHPHHRGEGRGAHEEGQGGPPQHPRDSAGHSCVLSCSFGCCISITVETVFPFLRLLYLPICSYCISLLYLPAPRTQTVPSVSRIWTTTTRGDWTLAATGRHFHLTLYSFTAPQLHHTAVSLHHTTHHNFTTLPFAPL